ncbi:DUF1071 domain-containing protein [bacterium 210820-DFI.6.52]|uniref:SSAP RNA binding domain-containing protein n=1 Tax=Bittarella massiliensis (ex Durand et al. 2017) TaxID=1720313 RepID=A0AAQ1RWY4_9FIRM|nr:MULTISPECIES: DUF1071 domain-containing protein [Eubacteriales]ERJ00842.1 hypothetical protein HMPREF0262_00431 [Clostridium sp. ATCC 29733]MCB5942623.1 DUF1071 domain-containing protein [bacterium 210820-DFI.6.52]SHG51340.1 Protein of unknown function [Bittarella massiliensis (ex Durand et al. 2017)]
MENYFAELNALNVGDKIEKKNGLSYLSWAWAWGEVKKLHPDAQYRIYENADGWNYHTDGRTCWVKTGVTVAGIEHIEYLPVMDNRNKSILAENVTSFDVNKAIQRSLTKALARHGLGLYIYAGEDLPEDAQKAAKEEEKKANASKIDEIKQASLLGEIKRTGWTVEGMLDWLSSKTETPVNSVKDITLAQYVGVMQRLERKPDAAAGA